MDISLTRRHFAIGGLAAPLFVLPACATVGDLAGPGLEPAIRRLLDIASQRAFANLLSENGFFADDLARIRLPEELTGAGALASALLQTAPVQNQLLALMNQAARRAADGAAPLIYETIRTMTITDALALSRGGPTAATDYLQRQLGTRIVEAMFPDVGSALRSLDNGIVNQIARAATGIGFTDLQRHVAEEAADGIYAAIGREEAQIRANPETVDDPLLRRLFGGSV